MKCLNLIMNFYDYIDLSFVLRYISGKCCVMLRAVPICTFLRLPELICPHNVRVAWKAPVLLEYCSILDKLSIQFIVHIYIWIACEYRTGTYVI